MPELFRLDKRVTSRLKAALDREWEALLLMAENDEPIPQRDIPSEAQLQSLVSAIFWASFEREESSRAA